MSEIIHYKSFIGGFERIFTDVCCVNPVSGKIRHISGESFMDSGGRRETDYEKVLQKYAESYVHPNDRVHFLKICSKEYVNTYLTKENPFYSEKFRYLEKNKYRWYQINVILSGQRHGHVKRIIFAIRDVYKDDIFWAGLSHDIRTPMNSMMGFVHLLEKEDPESPNAKYYIQKIANSGKQMVDMVDDFLGKKSVQTESFSVEKLAEDIYAGIEPLAKAKNLKFEMSYGEMNGIYISADKMKLTRILVNILTNAVKYTPSGGMIGMSVSRGEGTIIFKVSDNGIGMDEKILGKIFEPYVRGANTENIEGTGFGMTIVKKLVDYMDGTIKIKSRPGCGTVCTVIIPAEFSDADCEIAAAGNEVNVKPLAGFRILFAEDNAENAEIMSLLLSRKGALVTTVCNGAEAVEAFKKSTEGQYNLILMDINMPLLDGYGAAKAIRGAGRPDGALIPIIAMTGSDAFGECQKVIEAGMNGYVLKPVNINELEKVLKEKMGLL